MSGAERTHRHCLHVIDVNPGVCESHSEVLSKTAPAIILIVRIDVVFLKSETATRKPSVSIDVEESYYCPVLLLSYRLLSLMPHYAPPRAFPVKCYFHELFRQLLSR